MDFRPVEITQGTPAWHEWRRDTVGASDAPPIMGRCQWKTYGDLITERCSPNSIQSKSSAAAEGLRLEPLAREAFIERTKIFVKPACLSSTRYPWMHASVDGINFHEQIIVERKCGPSQHSRNVGSVHCPTDFACQLQHIFAVTGYVRGYLWSWRPEDGGFLREVERDEEFIERLAAESKKFLTAVQRKMEHAQSMALGRRQSEDEWEREFRSILATHVTPAKE